VTEVVEPKGWQIGSAQHAMEDAPDIALFVKAALIIREKPLRLTPAATQRFDF